MKYVQVFLLCVWSFHACGQVSPIVKFIDKTILNADMLVNIDSFGTIYSIDGDTFIKTQGTQNIYFSSIQLGNITSANVFNPLKFPVFYENFNTVVILDNRLAEITRVNFNDLTPFRLVTKISAGFDNAIWIYNQNTQQMELFDYLNRKTRIKSLPISGEVI
ncbi:MAG: hypothetical protein KJN68_05345, partial [Bacteroidia bacterium]|nr:hypothetical protein [Bacteroidia bacterium]